jgi:hypothetical protein
MKHKKRTEILLLQREAGKSTEKTFFLTITIGHSWAANELALGLVAKI